MREQGSETEKAELGSVAALLGVQAFFGSLPVIAKVVLAVVPAIALVGFRIGITAVVLAVVQLARGRFWLKETSDYYRLAILSIFGVTINQLLFVGGLSLTKASNTSLLAVTIPMFTLVAASVLGKESLTARKGIAIALAAAGVLLIIDPWKASFSSETTIGDVMIVFNSLSYGIYVAVSRSVIARNGAFRSMMWVFIFASIICVPLGLGSFSTIDVSALDISIWLLMAYIAIFATAAPYLLNAWALARVDPSMVAVFIYLQPVIGFVLAAVYLDESIGVSFMAAALLIFAGLYLTTRQTGIRETSEAE